MFERAVSISRLYLLGVCCSALLSSTALGQSDPLSEQTRLRLSVFQLMPQTGQYARWDAVSGELVVDGQHRVTVPVIGAVDVTGMTPEALAGDIAARLKSRLGLLDEPDTTIEIVSYAPIYVVGTVERPGEYTFRPGMTVLQALALGGGQLRSENNGTDASERIRLLAQLRAFENQIAHTSLRVARIEAELENKTAIDYSGDGDAAGLDQEQAVLEASRTARDRQIASLTDLQTLYQQEIDVLEQRTSDIDVQIANTEKELAGVAQLVEGGIATVSRRSELERILASLRSDKLDQTTSIMRAKQYMTEAERNADGIEDTQRTELTQQLLLERGTLEQSNLDAQTTRSLLADLDRKLLSEGGPDGAAEATLSFTVIRRTDGKVVEIPANEMDTLQPADVVKVTTVAPAVTVDQEG